VAIGNDVVSIAHLIQRSGERKQRYYKKTYTEKEIRLIETLNMKHVEGFFWALKESAYKAYFRILPEQIVSPKKFEVISIDGSNAKVQTPVGLMNSIIEVDHNYIHVITSQPPSYSLRGSSPLEKEGRGIESSFVTLSQVFQFDSEFHQEVKTRIAEEQNVSAKEIEISKDEYNVPTLKVKNQLYLLSLSHDCNWGAYAYQKHPISV
jgi:phosphopantetheinyl transferase (holo-ACP synthase)